MQARWPDQQIVRKILPHTGRLDGDDTGYRDLMVFEGDDYDPDPLVILPPDILSEPVYHKGATSKITPFYESGLGADAYILVREPVAQALIEVEHKLSRFGRRLLVLDGFRPADVQARLWSWHFRRGIKLAGLIEDEISPRDWISYGRSADDVASYCAVVEDSIFTERVQQLAASLGPNLARFGPTEAVAREIATYQANLGRFCGLLDTSANTAHGSGGAVDVILADVTTGEPAMMGVPFDSTSPAAVMDWFEKNDHCSLRRLISEDESLSEYYAEFGFRSEGVSERTIEAICRERRLLFHAMRSVGASFFSLGSDTGESWHFNLGNERGGRQSGVLPGAGNSCHSLLRNIVHGPSGRTMAVWGNASAHKLASNISSAEDFALL